MPSEAVCEPGRTRKHLTGASGTSETPISRSQRVLPGWLYSIDGADRSALMLQQQWCAFGFHPMAPTPDRKRLTAQKRGKPGRTTPKPV
eukprot:4909962-Alexandrium_andersonii.AAC.1